MKKKNNSTHLTVIFGSGSLGLQKEIYESIVHADLVIAADGGANHCKYLDISPDYLIGDLDSIEPQLLKIYQDNNTRIKSYPKDKDVTNLELALNLAMQEGAGDVWLLGVLGKRWDMSIANIMLAASNRYRSLQISLFSEDSRISILYPQKTHLFPGYQERMVSFIPLGTDVLNVTLEGFVYPLKGEDLQFGSTKGVSNIIKGDAASEIHEAGILLCIEII
jgi:thiamine pyrophosphokinase